VLGAPGGRNLSRVSKSWPVEQFNDYLRALMTAQGIENYAELSRLTGVSQNQFSNWRRGLAQPSVATLNRIAPVLGEPPFKLYVMAGLNAEEDFELDQQLDFTALPKPFHDLREVYELAAAAGRGDEVLNAMSLLVAGLNAQLVQVRRDPPSGRRRSA
jgi:transcriptional regulator with XRE-family HTH domain